MTFDTVWREIRKACSALDPDAVLVTPSSEQPLIVETVAEDRIVVAYRERDEERILWREQFEVLYERLREAGEVGGTEDEDEREAAGLSLTALPSGVEPYVAVASLASAFAVEDDTFLVRESEADAGTLGESPFVRAEWEVRTRPERVHDDALLLAEELERYDTPELDAETLETASSGELVNLYVLLSDVQRGADTFRKTVGDVLLNRIGPADELHGQFGTVHRTRRERRRLKPDEEILERLSEGGIPHEWVLGVDREKLDVVLAVTDLEEEAVYDVEQQTYVQKTGVEEAAKRSRLQGLKDRLAQVSDGEAEAIRDEIEDLETRIEETLAAD